MKAFVCVAMAALLLLSGCASAGRKIDQNAASKIEKGKTTQQEVVRLLGSPDTMTTSSDGTTTMVYSYAKVTPNAATFIPLVGVFAGGAEVKSQALFVVVGGDGVVRNYSSTQSVTRSGVGANSGSDASFPAVEEGKRPL